MNVKKLYETIIKKYVGVPEEGLVFEKFIWEIWKMNSEMLCLRTLRFLVLCFSQSRSSNQINEDPTPYDCPHCVAPRSFSHANSLRAHVRQAHYKSDIPKIPCTMCTKKFKSPREVTIHMRESHMGYRVKCPVCNKLYAARVRNIRKHIEIKHENFSPPNNQDLRTFCHLLVREVMDKDPPAQPCDSDSPGEKAHTCEVSF